MERKKWIRKITVSWIPVEEEEGGREEEERRKRREEEKKIDERSGKEDEMRIKYDLKQFQFVKCKMYFD